MKRIFLIAVGIAICLAPSVFAAQKADKPAENAKNLKVISEVYPNLVTLGLLYAKLAELPENVIVRSGSMSFTTQDLEKVIAQNRTAATMADNDQIYLLEMAVTQPLLGAEGARVLDISADGDAAPIYMYRLLDEMNIKATSEEINKAIKEQNLAGNENDIKAIKKSIIAQKKKIATDKIYCEIGKRCEVLINEKWLKEQLANAKESPIDEIRKSGKPSVLIFISSKPGKEWAAAEAEMDKIVAEYKGKVEAAYFTISQFPVLSARCGVKPDSTCGFVFVNKKGEETARHEGIIEASQLKKELEKIAK